MPAGAAGGAAAAMPVGGQPRRPHGAVGVHARSAFLTAFVNETRKINKILFSSRARQWNVSRATRMALWEYTPGVPSG